MIVLKLLGLLIVVLLVYVAARIFLFLAKAGIIIYVAKKLMTGDIGPSGVAGAVTLVPVAGASWDEDEEAARLAAPLPGLGYEMVGFHDLDVMGGVRLQSWVSPDAGLYAVVYRSPQVGAWSDVVSKYEDGSSLTYSNSPHGGKLRQRPNRENIYFRGSPTEELHHKMLAERPQRMTRRLSAADFAPDFEKAYADDIRWRNSPEGFDPDAVSPLAALSGSMRGSYSSDQLAQIRASMTRKMYDVVAQGFRESFRARGGVSDEEWLDKADRLVFVWDTMNAESLAAVLPGWSGLDAASRLAAHEVDMEAVRTSFAELNEGVPTPLRLRKIGEADASMGGPDSIRADVYLAPPETLAGVR